MDRLEQYIRDNRESFDRGGLPDGSRERFMARLEGSSARRSAPAAARTRRIIFGLTAGIAASLLLLFFIGGRGPQHVEYEYISILNSLDKDIIEMSRYCDSRTAKEAIKASRSIINEAVPLEDQLPAEISKEQRELILKGYYEKKAEGLKKIRNYLAMEAQTYNNK